MYNLKGSEWSFDRIFVVLDSSYLCLALGLFMSFEFDVLVCGMSGCSHMAPQWFWSSWSDDTFLQRASSSHLISAAFLLHDSILRKSQISAPFLLGTWSTRPGSSMRTESCRYWVCFLFGLCLCHSPANSSLAFYWSTDTLWTLTLSLCSRRAVEWFFPRREAPKTYRGLERHWESTTTGPMILREEAGRWGVGRRWRGHLVWAPALLLFFSI